MHAITLIITAEGFQLKVVLLPAPGHALHVFSELLVTQDFDFHTTIPHKNKKHKR